MRKIETTLLILITWTFLSAADTLGISGQVYRCDSNESEFFARGLWIYQNGDCKDVKVHSGGRFFIKDLNQGTYEIRYGNIWGQILSDSIKLRENIAGYKICIDKFKNRDTYPLIEKFKKSSTVEILQQSSGCFHSTETIIRFEKKDNKLLGTLKRDKINKRNSISSKTDIELINDFFMKIDLMNRDGGCTTVDSYRIKFDNDVVEIKDSNCDWNGFYEIQRQIFKVK